MTIVDPAFPSISPATADDIPRLCTLLSILFTQEADFQPDAEKQSAALRHIIGHPETGCILVLRENNDIIGTVNLLYSISTACGGRVAILEDLIIDPSRRGNGLGKKLLQAAITHARRNDCLRITLLTDRSNDAAIRLYSSHGFKMSEMVPLRLALDENKK